MKSSQTVEAYIAGKTGWQELLTRLRSILLSTGLKEEVKWGGPVYTSGGKNVLGIGAFKSYAGLWFFQGALLKDEQGLLINAQDGKTKAMRQMRFQSVEEMDEKTIRAYVEEAIRHQKLGKEIKPEKNKPLLIPSELEAAFNQDPALQSKFAQLTLTRQREFVEYIATAKREATRLSRLDKIKPMIMAGVGMNDKYK
jgi:uncharacterized protein YdeI (YjbR/CyaY-like superfamily)